MGDDTTTGLVHGPQGGTRIVESTLPNTPPHTSPTHRPHLTHVPTHTFVLWSRYRPLDRGPSHLSSMRTGKRVVSLFVDVIYRFPDWSRNKVGNPVELESGSEPGVRYENPSELDGPVTDRTKTWTWRLYRPTRVPFSVSLRRMVEEGHQGSTDIGNPDIIPSGVFNTTPDP